MDAGTRGQIEKLIEEFYARAFAPHVAQKLEEMAHAKNITQTEALQQLVEQNLDAMEHANEKFSRLERAARKARRP